MGARNKLNAAAVYGVLVIAAIIGIAMQSGFAFFVTLALGIGLSILSNDIRLSRMNSDRHHHDVHRRDRHR